MENQFFLNGGMSHHQHHPIHQFETASMQTTWRHHSSSSSSMEIHQQNNVANCSPENNNHQNQDSFYNNNNTDHNNLQFDSSALSSMVSSPSTAAPNFNMIQNDNSFVIRELIGKLGTIGGSSAEISPHSQTVALYNNNNTTPSSSCYSTPLNSPPKLNMPKPPPPSSSMALNSATVAEFSADPGFAERAAKFSCFGSRSFNGRTTTTTTTTTTSPLVMINNHNNNNGAELTHQRSNPIHRVSSSPSLKSLGSQMEKICSSPLEMAANSSQEESTISEQNPNVEGAALKIASSSDMSSRKRKGSSRAKAKDSTKGGEGSEESNAKRSKGNEGEGNENNGRVKVEEESKGEEKQQQNNKSNNSKPPEPPKDYIHVRARRGQATDSHSLAERVRREKISERMKLLQDLVPGCNKVTGKALMLDEIINYVQSLQRQVEFLSMKLAAVNPRLELNVDDLFAKEVFPACAPNFESIGMGSSEMTNNPAAYLDFNSVQQLVSCSNGLINNIGMNMTPSPDMGLRKTIAAPLSVSLPETFLDSSSCFNQVLPPSIWEGEFQIQNLYNVAFDQPRTSSFPPSHPFTGLVEASNLKMEMDM